VRFLLLPSFHILLDQKADSYSQRKLQSLIVKILQDLCDGSGSDISNIEKGHGPTNDISYLRKFDVNENWLRTGEGDIFNKLPRGSELGTYIPASSTGGHFTDV
jgi:hypothetical protein